MKIFSRAWWLSVVCIASGCSGDVPAGNARQAIVSDGMVVSQIYGGGGSPSASYHNDYVELFNRGGSAVDIGGWSLQYGSSSSLINLQVNIPASTTVAPNHYFLIRLGSSGSHGAQVPSPDLIGTSAGAFNISGADGKLALVDNTSSLGCGSDTHRCSGSAVVDLVGYGEGSDYESNPAVSPDGVTGALYRAAGGCVDTDDNFADFAGALALPRNGGSAAHACNRDGGAPDLNDLSENVDLLNADLTSLDLTTVDLTPAPIVDLSTIDLRGALPATGGPIVISQIFGSGGDSGARYRNDFVELFNRSTADLTIGGWSLQYASKDNNFALEVVIPDDTELPAGSYFLIRLSSGGGTGMTVADPDLTVNLPDVLNISAASGKLALVDKTALAGCGTASHRCASPPVVDLVGYGVASDFEGAPTDTFGSAAESLFRKDDGCIDSDHNDDDFAGATANPRNSGSPVHICDGSVVVMNDAAVAPADAAAAPSDLATARPDLHIADGGAKVDAGFDGAVAPLDASTRPPGVRAASGCSCDFSAGGSPGAGGWVIGLLLIYWRRRLNAGSSSARRTRAA